MSSLASPMDEFSFDFEGLESSSLSELLDIVTSQNIVDWPSDYFHHAYFEWSEKKGISINSGVIATPKYVADFMVRETMHTMNKCASELSWYDPCCGSGIFVESILNHCKSENGLLSLKNLPSITAIEISPIGIFCTALVINKILGQYGLNISEYMASEKLQLILDDSLSIFEEQQPLIGGIKARFDVVIGNPPYVRASRLSPKQKQALKQRFPLTYYGTADLYFYFISSAMSSLKDDGSICFISPANFFRSISATPLRSFLESRATLVKLIDLDELPVFHNADIHTAIYWLKNSVASEKNKRFYYSHLTSMCELEKLKDSSVQYENLLLNRITSSGWQFSSEDKSIDINTYNNVVSLKDAGIVIYSGIRPGLKKAFVHDENIVSSLSKSLVNKWFRPCVEAKSITKWSNKQGGKLLLLVRNGQTEIPKEIEKILGPYKEDLTKRHESKSGSQWFALRACSYYEIFDRPRIVFPDISGKSKFSLDTSKNIALDGTFVIATDNKALLGILNSRLAWNYFVNNCSSIGNAKNKGRLRLKKSHVEKFPIPKALFEDSNMSNDLSGVVEKIITEGETPLLEEELNRLVEKLYAAHK